MKTVILVVDDQDIMRRIARAVIEKNFPLFQVATCDDGKQGLEFYEQNAQKIALILTDYRMPNMNGLTLIEKVREKNKEIGIILASGDNNPEFHTSSANFFLHKPYEVRGLTSAIEAVLENTGVI